MDESDNILNGSENQPGTTIRRRSTALRPRPGHAFSRADTNNHQLSPSNLASKPSETKYSSIKIKPGRAYDHNKAAGIATDHLKGTGVGEQSYAAVVPNPAQGTHKILPRRLLFHIVSQVVHSWSVLSHAS